MKNVLVIGGGKRAQNAVLPALWCLRDTHKIAGVVTRHKTPLSLMRDQLNVQTIDTLDGIDWPSVDVVMVAVPPKNVAGLLADLASRDVSRAVLLLDTPVIAPAHVLAIRHFRRFAKVLVSEDTVALPPFLLVRTMIDEGRIGKLRRIHFFHNGYKYHGLASLKMLASTKTIRSMHTRRYPQKIMHKDIAFANGVTAQMFEPRDYTKGRFLIEGTTGCIADFDMRRDDTTRIGYAVENNVYRGLTVDGQRVAVTGLDAAYLANITEDVPDASLMNTMKIRGLMDLIVASTQPSSPFHYAPSDAIIDNVSILFSEVATAWRYNSAAQFALRAIGGT